MNNDSLPQDPAMLLSFVNMKLRDEYPSLDAMCDDMDLEKEAETMCYVYGKIKRENGESGCLDFCWLSDSQFQSLMRSMNFWPSGTII